MIVGISWCVCICPVNGRMAYSPAGSKNDVSCYSCIGSPSKGVTIGSGVAIVVTDRLLTTSE
jgi:hypothetical protein